MTRIGATVVVALVIAGAALAAGQAQRPIPPMEESRPGYPAPARVWIQNHGPAEAVPVRLEGRNQEAVGVELRGRPSVDVGDSRPLAVHAARQAWEYRRVVVDPAADVTAELNRAGADGWEAVGTMPLPEERVAVILKRPKS